MKDLEVNKKGYIKIFCTCIAVVLVLLVVYYFSLLKYTPFTLENDTIISNEGMNLNIDVFVHEGKKVEISGWAYKEDESIKTINCSYVLKNEETGKMYILKTRREKNTNVPEVYSVSGIHTRFMHYGLSKGRYDIYVLYKNNDNNILANTGIYLDI